MNVRYHGVPQDLFCALAAGGGGADAMRELVAAQYSKHVFLLRGVLAAAQSAGGEQAGLARHGYDLLAAVQRHDAAVAAEVIRQPSVGAWALRTIRAIRGEPTTSGAEPRGLSAVAAAAAIRARFPAEIEVPVVGGIVALPSLGAAIASGRTAMVRITSGGAEVCSAAGLVSVPQDPQADAPGWLGLRRIQAGSLDVLIDDLGPFRMPGHSNLASRLSAMEADKWRAALEQAWLLLEAHHPESAAEVAAAVTVLVPLCAPQHGQLSSSSPETFGSIALSEPSTPALCAVTLAHEVLHLKLAALLDVVSLTMPDDGQRYYAPWRDDPRPIGALLQGAYAHLGVSGFWRRQRHLADGASELQAHTEFARWRAATAAAVETLRTSGRLTPAGVDFTGQMAETLSAWRDEPVPPTAQALALREAEEHLARWQSSNWPIPA